MKDSSKNNRNREEKKSKVLRLASVSPVIWVTIAFVIMAWWALPVRNGVFMRWMEACSLFEPTESARNELLRYPGGLLQYAGSYLMQFMHYPALGSAILIALWIVLTFLTVKCFRLSRSLAPLALLLPLMLLESIMVLDQAWLTILYKGYVFAPTLGFIATVGLIWICRLMGSRWGKLTVAMITVALYPWLGFYALLAGVVDMIFILMAMRKGTVAESVGIVSAIGLMIFFIPKMYYRYFNGTWVEGDYLWIKGLPDLIVGANDLYLFLPFILVTVVLIAMALCHSISDRNDKAYAYFSAVILVVAAGWCSTKIEKPEDWRAMALMQLHIDDLKWNRAVAVADNMRGPLTPELASLASMGREICGMPAKSYNVKSVSDNDTENLRHRTGFLRSALLWIPGNYFLGHCNLTYRWAMEHSVMYGHRALFIKYMVKACLVNGDYELARHYNDMLARTIYHRDWSEHYGKFIEHPELIADDPELGNIHTGKSSDVFY